MKTGDKFQTTVVQVLVLQMFEPVAIKRSTTEDDITVKNSRLTEFFCLEQDALRRKREALDRVHNTEKNRREGFVLEKKAYFRTRTCRGLLLPDNKLILLPKTVLHIEE